MSELKMKDLDAFPQQLNLDELVAETTPLARRAEILASLRERFEQLVAGQTNQAQASVIISALCDVSASFC